MRNKIVMFAVLLSLLVSIALPGNESITAMAEEVQEYTFVEWCADNGFNCSASTAETNAEKAFNYSASCCYVYLDSGSLLEIKYWSTYLLSLYYSYYMGSNTFYIKNASGGSANIAMCFYEYETDGWKYTSGGSPSISGGKSYNLSTWVRNPVVVYTNNNIFADFELVNIWCEKTAKTVYDFRMWCVDAGLNCEFVDVEGQSVDYTSTDMYVVRRGASADNGYLYYLTRVNIERDGLCFPTLSNGLVGVGTMSNEWQTYNVYQYEYDYALGCWCATENFVSQEVRIGSPSSGLNCALGNGKGLVYSNRDLFSGDFSVAYAESTEFVDEPFYGGISDVVSPSPTPEVPSGGGSGNSNSFDIVTYSSQIKAEVKADSVNMRDKPSLEGNVVASFIKTWNVDVLGYVYADDGAVWYYCKTVRDDMEYIGFIKAEYLTVLSVENNDFNIDFGDIDLEDSPELIETAKNSFIELLGFVGVVPMMIGVVFGFLPSWCLGIVGVSVVVLCFLAIIKRG